MYKRQLQAIALHRLSAAQCRRRLANGPACGYAGAGLHCKPFSPTCSRTLDPHELTSVALAAFDQVVAATAGFRARPGQREMAERIAIALADVSLGDHANPDKAISVIQAGTGVGKSPAYLTTTCLLYTSGCV